ncbi:MAG: HAMP domain-containing protein [Planctomycetes bacterium]|nr:HAMP domain-containing protein [Planctomycetota bacterium]
MMTPAASLARRFYIVLFFCFLVGALVWGTFAARKAGDRLEERSRAFLEAGAARVDEILGASADRQADLMDRAVSRLSANLDREFADVPFDVFRDREDLLLEYLRERLDQARERQRANTALIADIFREEARDRAFHAFEGLVTDQERQVGELADRLSRDLLVWGGAFLLGIGVLLGLVFHATVIRPLRRATLVFEQMRAGDLSRRLRPGGGEEIDRLARSFNAMAEEIESYQRDLEDRVARKTAALSSALAEQQETNDTLRATLDELSSTQKQLIESAKMAALGTMARGMAHEFNNILGGISGCAADLAEDVDDEDARRVLDVIARSSRRALVITENLLSFSRGSQHVRGMVALRELLDQAVALVEPEASRRGLVIEVSGPEAEPLRTDGRGLQQVLLNLLINAVQASTTGGRVRARFLVEEDAQIFEIEDEGAGIAAADMDHIFEPFFSTKEQEPGAGGTGLGLSVARGIVTELDGRIEASSAGPGRGSCFRVVVPVSSRS